MIFSSAYIRWVSLCAVGLLASCSTTSEPKPALLKTSDAASIDALTKAVSDVIGSPVTLAPDSFTERSFVTIEPASVRRRNGRIIDGRSMEIPTPVDLVMVGRSCFVVNRETGKRFEVDGVNCKAAPAS